jgi:hypothetical protein
MERDKNLISLMGSMQEVYLFVDIVQPMPSKIRPLEDVIGMILKQTIESVIFIREYTGHGFRGQAI